MRLGTVRCAFLVALAGCWHAPPRLPVVTKAAPVAAPAPTLATEPQLPGRLLFDREGRAWEAACDGSMLGVRPWEGGAFQPAGPCGTRDGIHDYSGYDYYTEHVFLDAHAGVATRIGVISNDGVTATIRENGAIARTFTMPAEVRLTSIAFDGAAILLFVDRISPQRAAIVEGVSLERALSAIVRVESARTTMRSLVDYLSSGPSFAPRLVVPGRDQMLLVGAAGGVRTCRYDLVCADAAPSAPSFYRALPLADGGALLYDHEHYVSLLEPNGKLAWTTKGLIWGIFGASTTEVWIAEMRDPRWRHFDLVALDRATGKRLDGARGRFGGSKLDPLGNFLAIAGIAPTPRGPVIRGVFGGLLSSGSARLTTKTLGAICWWENPHDGNRYEIPLDGTCGGRHAKAILTEHAAFIATDAHSFEQRRIEPRH